MEYYKHLSETYSEYPIVSAIQKCNNVRIRCFIMLSFESFIEKYRRNVVRYNIYFDDEFITFDMMDIIMDTLKKICPTVEFMTVYETDISMGFIQVRWTKNDITTQWIEMYSDNQELFNYIADLCDVCDLV